MTEVKRFAFVLPDELDAPTGGYVYARRLINGFEALGVPLLVVRLPGGYPNPDAHARAAARSALNALPAGSVALVDGLALGALPQEAAEAAQRITLVALIHHPLALETGLPAEKQRELLASERSALANCHRIITTSTATAAEVARMFDLPSARIVVAEPGIDRPVSSATPRSRHAGPIQLLCVAAIVPRKGHMVLFDALAGLTFLDWRLVCVGALDRDPGHARAVAAHIRALGLDTRVELAGALNDDQLNSAWALAEVFVLASDYEGYGMACAEALARGLPVVTTTAAVVPQLLAAGAARVAPGNVAGLRNELSAMFADPARRTRAAAQSRAVADTLPRWSDTVATVAQVLRRTADEVGRGAVSGRARGLARGGGFSAAWLAAREPFDHAARNRNWPTLAAAIAQRERVQPGSTGWQRVVDLGAGAGSNLRFLVPRLRQLRTGTPHEALLIDADASLLARAARRLRSGSLAGLRCVTLTADLADLSVLPPLSASDLVSAAALADLVSAAWIDALVERCHAAGAAMLISLTYDGRTRWSPPNRSDPQVLRAFHRDQRSDKGFGAALGHTAVQRLMRQLRAAGFEITSTSSDWRLRSALRRTRPLIGSLLDDHAAVALRRAPACRNRIPGWSATRARQSREGCLRVLIGHLDVLALPPTRQAG